MPGPCNSKKKRKQQAEKAKAKRLKNLRQDVLNSRRTEPELVDLSKVIEHKPLLPSVSATSPQCDSSIQAAQQLEADHVKSLYYPTQAQETFIHNPGNGPRVSDMSAYLSSFFVPPPAVDDPLCAALTYKAYEVLSQLENTLGLPHEVALIVWYNKTRKLGRVCPACQRIYRLGDTLTDPITSHPLDPNDASTPSWVLREQYISGLCSAPCFTLASYTTHPYVADVVRGAWGRIAEEIDDEITAMLAAPRTSEDDQGLGTVLRVTRLMDLGLGSLLGLTGPSDAEGDETDEDNQTNAVGQRDGPSLIT